MNALNQANAARKAAASSATDAAAGTNSALGPTQNTKPSFEQLLDSLNQSENNSSDLVQKLSGGGSVDLHQVMLGIEENDINFRVSLAMRDKLVDAYKEVMRMQV